MLPVLLLLPFQEHMIKSLTRLVFSSAGSGGVADVSIVYFAMEIF